MTRSFANYYSYYRIGERVNALASKVSFETILKIFQRDRINVHQCLR